ncbi:MAG: serine/threonine protein kinase [Deltaproteobacteria bacterium]|nr:serine/threonine protein kinase [Deltaproteobacteria bacterium]
MNGVVERFGKYDLLRKIGQGGMAEIFAAKDRDGQVQGGAEIVVKRLHRELEKSREVIELFTTEADVTLLLNHPGLIRVYEGGEIDGRYYMAMEFVRGWTLEALMEILETEAKPFDLDASVHIVAQVLEVMEYVHQAKLPSGRPLGLIHRDVTPSNIYVTYAGEVKLGDFGVAKLVGVDSWTMAGSIKGKIGYLAPEQVAGLPMEQSIDRYAAAIVLYEMICGRRCFLGENELEIMLKIRDAKVTKPRKLNEAIPRKLQSIVMKALERKPKCRYKSSREFADALYDYRDRYGSRVLESDLCDLMVKAGLRGPPK